ncbi:MAG: type I glyceraldehyde-3-phosphate dehydrogenase [Alphaproteobacteria bacterium]|nr:type I glyceraldehyde-3-phosphate dehydrogenase [Alphaproteobacteria bacterium]
MRAIIEQNRRDIEVVAVNGPADVGAHVHLLKYDSVHGAFNRPITVGEIGEDEDRLDTIDMGHGPFRLYRERDPLRLPWKALDIDIVLECTGKYTKRADAMMHLEAGAKKVLISAPSPDADATIVYGVNNAMLKSNHTIVSVGSCTTNGLAPVAKVLHDMLRIETGFMTTIHSFTGDQRLLDGSHKDLRRARAATMAMVPTSTGAAKAIGLVMPELAGKLSGTAIRVPTPNVSLVDLTVRTRKNSSPEDIHDAMREASQGALQGVLGICDEPLVSTDFNHSSESSIYDESGTFITDGNFIRIAAWYDNEWGFSCRMLDVARMLEEHL